MGYRIIGIDVSHVAPGCKGVCSWPLPRQTGSEKEKLSKELGAEVFIDFKTEKDIVSAIKKVTPEEMGAHAAIITAATAAAYEQALEYIRPGGTVVAVGLPGDCQVKAEVFFHVGDT